MKLQQRFNLLVVPMVVLPLFLLGGIAYKNLYAQSQKASFATANDTLFQLNQQVAQELTDALANIDLLATDLTIQQYALTEDEQQRYSIYQRGMLNRFLNYKEAHPLYEEIRFILPDGYEDARWAKNGLPNATDEEADSWWFQTLQAAGNSHFYTIGSSDDSGEMVMYVFKSIYLGDVTRRGQKSEVELRGFLGITISLKWLQEKMNLLSKQGRLCLALVSPQQDVLLASEQFSAAQLADLMALHSNNNSMLDSSDMHQLDGADYYLGSTPTLGKYSFISAAPAAGIHSVAQKLSLNVALITLCSVLVTILVLSLFLRRVVVSPLQTLVDASKRIGAGKRGTDINFKGEDELSELAQSFNRMSRDLALSDEKMRYIADHDNLTQLPNRRWFQLYLKNAIASARRMDSGFALLFLDIDNFKTINDTLGHGVGDQLLKVFAGRIGGCIREEDFLGASTHEPENAFVARHGGDEFTVILPRIDDPRGAAIVAERIIRSLEDEIAFDGHSLRLSTSIGITLFPEDGDCVDGLLQCADAAMYHAKDRGKNNYQFYTSELKDRIVDRIESEKELRLAIARKEMTLRYQPQISGDSEEVYGFEALVRWDHPEKGIISPLKFISLAEETGLIVDLGAWILHEACRQAAQWISQGFSDFRISVNVSSVQFTGQDVAALIARTLEETGLPGTALTIELTESILIAGEDSIWDQLQAIREQGVSIALDDFGTGYSSLSYLRTFPVDILKIDRSFVVESEKEQEVRAIITAIVEMARALSLKVVAEGVEEELQLAMLQSIDCDVIQGYYYSPPLPALEAERFLAHYEGARLNSNSAA